MIASRFPIFHTNPAGFSKAGIWPVPTGILAVLFIPVLLGVVLQGIGLAIPSSGVQDLVYEYGTILMYSIVFSWAPLIFAVPISAVLARKGYAGWGIALLGGALAGWITLSALEGRLLPPTLTYPFMLMGAFFALVYWGAIRLMHPTAIGVAFRPSV